MNDMEIDVMRGLLFAALLLALTAGDASAARLYKLTDSKGRVTYLDRPPANFDGKVEAIDIDTTQSTVKLPNAGDAVRNSPAAQIIHRGQEQKLSSIKAAELEIEQAKAQVEAARAALQNAQDNSLAEDWIYIPPRNRAPRPEYAARLEALDAAVKGAEQRLADAERRLRLL
jgi:hypothetical protein